MSGDPEQEYFADGIVEDIITALSRFNHLFVIARNSSFAYKGRNVDVTQIGRDLGVRDLLEGSVRKAGNRVRITGQLIDTAPGAHLWANRFDGELADIFDLQDQVTASVVEALACAQAAHRELPNFPLAPAVVAASAALLGRAADAASAMARLRQTDPDLCLSTLAGWIPLRRPADAARWALGLRRAGLPE